MENKDNKKEYIQWKENGRITLEIKKKLSSE